MNRRRFFIQLSLITVSLVCIVFLISFFPIIHSHQFFLLGSILFYSLLSIAMFYLAAKAAVSKDKNAFTRLVMILTFIKLLLTVVLVIFYKKIANPDDITFIIPFFLIYFAYTIFETIFLSRLGKIKVR